ncbi:MAG: hypothetical protein QOD92_487 [Acidimicrobiaceae bacterium]|jgi:hypothetical protein
MAWQRSPHVVYEVVDGQAVLVDPEGVELITLNAVGTVVWEELDGEREAADLAADLLARFEGVTRSQLETDIAEFLSEVDAVGLVSRRDDVAR